MNAARDTSVRIDTLACDFAPRTAARAAARSSSSAGVTGPATSSGVGQDARWIEPSCHHDHTSSVTYGMIGASSRSTAVSATASAAWAEAPPLAGAVRPLLHRLQVVVAERPEELLGDVQRAGVVVRVERRGGLDDHPFQPGQQRRSSGSVTAARSAAAASPGSRARTWTR